ncbi:MAG: hypothetical protein ACREO5_00300 [Candidatus Binatia bacterium]
MRDPPSKRYFPCDHLLARSAVNASLTRLHDLTCDSLPRLWNAVQKGWCPPPLYAVCVRDQPLRVCEELVRLLSAVHFYLNRTGVRTPVPELRENLPANTAAQTANL